MKHFEFIKYIQDTYDMLVVSKFECGVVSYAVMLSNGEAIQTLEVEYKENYEVPMDKIITLSVDLLCWRSSEEVY